MTSAHTLERPEEACEHEQSEVEHDDTPDLAVPIRRVHADDYDGAESSNERGGREPPQLAAVTVGKIKADRDDANHSPRAN